MEIVEKFAPPTYVRGTLMRYSKRVLVGVALGLGLLTSGGRAQTPPKQTEEVYFTGHSKVFHTCATFRHASQLFEAPRGVALAHGLRPSKAGCNQLGKSTQVDAWAKKLNAIVGPATNARARARAKK